MKTQIAASVLAVLGGGGAMLAPATAQAGKVGHFDNCEYFHIGDISGAVTAAGHQKVVVTELTASSLSGLNALVIHTCYGDTFDTPNAALNAAVHNGMGLVIERSGALTDGSDNTGLASANLPGSPSFSTHARYGYPANDNIELVAGSPVTTGPAGALTSTNLDRGSSSDISYNFAFYYPAAALPSGATQFLTNGDPSHVVAFGYTHGAGRVAYADSQAALFMPGGERDGVEETFAAGLQIYLSNAIAWAAGAGGPVDPEEPASSCAEEGFTGTKLLWCQNVCENGHTGALLTAWIRRWTDRFRELPYCAVAQE